MTAPAQQKVIVFGSTGAIGTALVENLSKDYPQWEILAVTRSTGTSSRLAEKKLPNVTMVEGDPFQKDQVESLSKDCDKIYCCIGFHKYETKYWAVHWPLVVDNLLNAIVAGDKKRQLIFCDNLYAYIPGEKINENSPRTAPSLKTKPAIRSLIRGKFEKHMAEHPGTLTVLGAADFFGPHVTASSTLGDIMTGKIMEGQSPLALCSATKIHDFCYAPDFAKAMAVASVSDKAYGKFWVCPHTIHGKTLTEIANDIAKLAHAKPKPVKMTVLPTFALALLSPFVGMMYEFYQMRDFWRNDYTIDDSKFCSEFDMEATSYETALEELVSFYRENKESS